MPVPLSPSAQALLSAIRRVARGEKRLLLIHGLASFLAAVLAVALAAGLTDYLLRLRDPGLRWGLSGLVLASIVYWFWRRVWPAVRFERSNVSTAQRIETCFPEVGDRVSNAVAFLDTTRPEATAGSVALRRNVVERAWEEVQPLSLSQCLTPQPTFRAAMCLAAILLVMTGMLLLDPAAVRLSAQRLAIPWGNLPWPRRHVLQFVDTPRYLGPGENFEASVADEREELPESVTIEYWFDGDPPEEIESRPMRFAGGRMVHRLTNVQRPFRFRAVGGDDDTMDWLTLSLVEPPQVESLRIGITPPAYLGALRYEVTGPITGVVGSRVTMEGEVDRPLAGIQLLVTPVEALVHEDVAPPWSGHLSADRSSFQLPPPDEAGFLLEQSGTYGLELTDSEQRAFAIPPGEVQAREDQPPNVRLLAISRDGIVTSQARLELTILADDDFALASVELQVERQGNEEVRLPVWTRAEPPKGVTVFPSPMPDNQRLVYSLDLSGLPLSPGDVVDLVATAVDYRPQSGSSSQQRLRVVSLDEFEKRLAQQQSDLVAKIQESVRTQREVQTQTESLRRELVESGEVARSDLDRLQSAELNQRRVPQLISEDSDSILSLIQRARDELVRNRLERPEIQERLARLEGELESLAGRNLPEIQRDLLEAIKLAPNELGQPQPLPDAQGDALRKSTEAQGEVLERLEAIAQRLAEWESYRRFASEADQLWREQLEIRQDTESLQPKTVGRELRELESPERAALKRLEQQQTDLTRRFEHFLERIGGKETSLAESHPELAEHLAAGSELAREENLSGVLRDTARRLEQNQLGQALESQQVASEGLEDVSRALAGLPPKSSDSSPQQQAEGGRDQQQADSERQRRREQLEQLVAGAAELAARQQELGDETAQLARESTANPDAPDDDFPALESVAQEQQLLKNDAESLRSLVPDSLLFTWQLDRITAEMNSALGRLEQRALSEAEPHQQRAARRLQEFVEAAKPPASQDAGLLDEDESASSGSDQNRQSPEDEQSRGPRLGLEEIRLLRSLQAELLTRTRKLADQASREELAEEERLVEMHAELAAEQEQLAMVLMELLGDRSEMPAEKPKSVVPGDSTQREDKLLDDLDQQLFP